MSEPAASNDQIERANTQFWPPPSLEELMADVAPLESDAHFDIPRCDRRAHRTAARVWLKDHRCVSSPSGAVSSAASFGSMPSSRDASRLVRIPTFAASLTTGSSITPR